MTPLQLQDDIAKEIQNLTKDMVFKDPKGKDATLKGFKQELPKILDTSGEEEDEYYPFPFAVVKLLQGDTEDYEQVNTAIVIGIYDDSTEHQGHMAVMNVIQKFKERFMKNPLLTSFTSNNDFKWQLNDEDKFPYYFGAIYVSWTLPTIRREDKFI
ncbi:hypothetical protein lbkm_0684 [Lachnospiraceae bacterium KM106-2]|nr:hypothetical protein lbkm_0684 [Lachnospiraceae bacterium KM106-2]